MSTFKDRIQHICSALGLSQSQFASKYGVNRQTMYAITSGRNEPSLKLLIQLCDVEPRISSEYLLKGIGSPLIKDETESITPPPTMDSLLAEVDLLRRQNEKLERQINILTEQNAKLFDYMMSTRQDLQSIK